MKNRTKGLLALILVLALIGGLTACGSGGSVEMTGGWSMPVQNAVELPKDVKAGFDKVAGKDLVPVALVAQQVVSGTNDMILCRKGNEYRMITLYRDLQGTSSITNDVPFVLTDYTNGGDKLQTTPLAGGWHTPSELTSIPLPDDAKTAFKNASLGFSGNNIESMALLGTQVVAGMDYAILCRVTPDVENAVSTVQVIIIYSDPQKSASITSFSPV
ncbi:MAG: hypothetical protein II745_07820, partial [Lachnospiraceae bacterium]|nr:hypothetical protein [Lachnospiraceae bacterium]